MSKKESMLRMTVTGCCELCAVCTLFFMIQSGQYNRIPLAAVTILLVLLPALLERMLRSWFSTALYLFCILYAIGPMLGQCWNFYYTISWWDKLLHTCGGVLFAIVGIYLYRWLEPESKHSWMEAAFGLLVSMAVAVLWEFAEFAMDTFLGMDMQDDMLITGICSYMLGDVVGQTGRIDGITSVLVNGKVFPGYIDIGLIDTMLDLLLETLGAAVTCVLLAVQKTVRGKGMRVRDE